jgi:hypothetical protein
LYQKTPQAETSFNRHAAAYPGFLLHFMRQGDNAATNIRQIAFFGKYKSVHNILDAASRRLRQGADSATKRREDAA